MLVSENEEKEGRIKLYKEKIARLTRKLEKRPTRSLEKSSKSEEEKTFVQSEASKEEVHSKKGGKLKNGGSLNLITSNIRLDCKCSQRTTWGRCTEDSPLHQALH